MGNYVIVSWGVGEAPAAFSGESEDMCSSR
jgi:hypothetical protein